MAINKVVYGNNVLVDLTNDTVSPENLQSGATAHSKSGNIIRGTANMGGAAPCSVLLANAFSTSINYNIDDYTLYDGGLYRFLVNHPAGAWNSAHVIQVTMSEEANYLKFILNNSSLFKPGSEEWVQVDNWNVIGTTQYPAKDKDLYIGVLFKSSWNGNGGLVIRVYDSSNNLLGSKWFYVQYTTPQKINIKVTYPSASYFKIEVNTNIGSIAIRPYDVAKRILAYVGYTEISSLNEVYPLYRYDQFIERSFERSDNLFDLEDGSWKQGRGDSGTQPYIVSSTIYHPVTDEEIYFCQKRTGFNGSAYGGLLFEIFDSNYNFIDTIWPTTSEEVAKVKIKNLFSNAAYFRLELNTNSGSINISPSSVIGKIEAYVGYTPIVNKDDIIPCYVAGASKHSERLAKRVSDLENGIVEVSNIYTDYMNKRIPVIQNLDTIIGNHGDSFIFITDLHAENRYYCANLAKRIINDTNAKMLIFGGDYINEINSKAIAIKKLIECRNNVAVIDDAIFVRGNHDTNPYGGSGAQLTESEYYGIFVKHLEKYINTEGKTYFYKDNLVQKIRYFFLDNGTDGTFPQEQQDWFETKSQELDASWHIIVVMHYGIYTEEKDDRVNILEYSCLTTVKECLENVTAKVCCIICGHVHIDLSSTSGNYPIIATTCNAYGAQSKVSSNDNRTEFSINEQAFDVFHIDTNAKKIYVTRIGAGQFDVRNGDNLALNDRVFTYA